MSNFTFFILYYRNMHHTFRSSTQRTLATIILGSETFFSSHLEKIMKSHLFIHFQITHVINLMKENYNQVRICPYRGSTDIDHYGNNVTTFHAYCDLSLEPDLTRIMEKSRDEEELRHIWSEWRDKVGPPSRNTFMRYIDLANSAAIRHGFRDAGEQMRSVYEDPDFFFTVQDLWSRIQPLYKVCRRKSTYSS